MALGLLRALQEAGRRVPEEISVVGFDDIPEATYFYPPLTTVRQDFDELGQRALRTLIELIDGRPGVARGPRMPVTPELMVRSSAAQR
jgi:DNA-binding LacI/PurR family transcriptional regulator